jgi:CDP-glycerol glycerophosphotransferase
LASTFQPNLGDPVTMSPKLIRTASLLLNLGLYWLALIFPKSSNLWIFGSWFGQSYSDNSRYLFEWVIENKPEIRAVWVTSNRAVHSQLMKQSREVYFRYSLKAIVLGLRASVSVFVQSNECDNMLFMNNPKTIQVQLWHGTPLKKIGLDDSRLISKSHLSMAKNVLFPFANPRHDLITASSQEDFSTFSSAFNSDQACITGYARNDLLKPSPINFDAPTIAYLPTFRNKPGSKIDLLMAYGFNPKAWHSFLERINGTLIIKMHPVNRADLNDALLPSGLHRIKLLEGHDATQLIKEVDILITDYSSLFFDFLLCERPIIFAPFGHSEYLQKDRTFYYDYHNITPGPKCVDWNAVLSWSKRLFHSPQLFHDERRCASGRFHAFSDHKNRERIFFAVKNLLDK